MNIKQIIESFIDKKVKIKVVKLGIVSDINETELTCTFTPNDGTTAIECILFQTIPVDGSVILVGYTNDNDCYCLTCFEIDKIIANFNELIYNGGNLGGIVKAVVLKTESEKDKDILDTFLQVLHTPINEPGNGSPSAFQAALLAALTGKQTGTWDDLENDKIKH